MKSSSIKLSVLSSILLGSSLLASKPLHAESNVVSNVQGDEIIIYSDESFKPALRDMGSPGNGQNDYSQKNSDRKNTSPLSNAAPTYNSSPIYNSGDGVMPKSPRDDRITKVLDLTIPPNDTYQNTLPQVERDDLWQRIKNGYAMPESTSSLTQKHEQWYSSRPDYVKRMVERSQRYLFHVVEEVEKRGMPTEIALLPMIESAYNPKAYSTSRASGIWQFVPSTGKYFGLKQNWWFDNRRNITFATDAALTYLQKLHAMFGAWDLALAAYNAGEGTVSRAIERNRRLGLPTDYESLNLPPETRNYVPKLQAVKNLMTNPGNYGLNIQTIANTPYFAKVTAPAQIDAHLAAKLAEISDEEFLALNPSFNRPVITNENKNVELLLPIVAAQNFRTNLENYNKPLVSWKTYFAKKGERLEKIADKFGIHVSKLRDVNDLPAQSKIKKTATILVPNGNRTDFKADGNNAAGTPETALQSTDTDFSANPEHGAANINLADSEDGSFSSESGDENEPKENRSVRHKVKKGEVMATIAKRYGVSVKQIMAANSLKTSRVKTGQVLNINAAENSSTKTNKTNDAKKTQSYIVKRGDTLHSISQKFDVTVADLKRWNKKYSSHIQPGNKLTIKQSDAS
ncbi:LysM peptidoglycan-binding domain-containing protein [Methylotenera sp. G11]|uniref:LysM peptidoglycan-binding domain-containing protein n=1 Tax=Methylotenera sp. G11 TaxID=1506585 RepID=UPI0006916624|nr:LysM peptidoglycan-binding domain-containing protein [Methylotenera sp. G11]